MSQVVNRLLTLLFLLIVIQPTTIFANTPIFTIHDEIHQSNFEPFTATIAAFGNGHTLSDGGGFEPSIFRTAFLATESAKNMVYGSKQDLSYYDSWKESALDGASVEILRIESGKFKSIRQDIVTKNGHFASGWHAPLYGRYIPKNTNEFKLNISGWSKQNTQYYFMLKTLDSNNKLSVPSSTVIVKPSASSKGETNLQALPKVKIASGKSAISPPTNVHFSVNENGAISLKWNKVKGAKGYILYRSDVPPERHKGYSLQLASSGPEIKKGDLVIVRKKFYSLYRDDLLTNRVWLSNRHHRYFSQPMLPLFKDELERHIWQLKPHEHNSSVPNSGETYFSVNLKDSAPLSIGQYNHSGTAQLWYDVLDPTKTYTLEVWARGDSNVSAVVKLPGLTEELQLSDTWKHHVITFSPPELYIDSKPRNMEIVLKGPGRVDIDNIKIYRSDAKYLAFLPEDLKAAQQGKMAFFRTHGFIKTFFNTYNLQQLTNNAGNITANYGNTLPQTLNAFAKVRTNPWLQIEPHFSEEEWLGLIEYLAAPYNPQIDTAEVKPWANKRYQQGQIAPYSDKFSAIRLEIGNETWNRMFRPWTFNPMTDSITGKHYSNAEVYGLYQEYVMSIIKRSPYWSNIEGKFETVIGGWTINSYGETAAKMSPSTDIVTVAEYNGGWDQGEGVVTDSPESLQTLLDFAQQTAVKRAKRHVEKVKEIAKHHKKELKVGTYEAGPGYVRNGLNNEKVTKAQYLEQERVMKGPVAAAATLDTFLTQLREGYNTQNFFLFQRGDYWSSHAKWYQSGEAYPSWQWVALFNNVIDDSYSLLKTSSENVATRDIPAFKKREPVTNAPVIDIFPFFNGDSLVIFAIKRTVNDDKYNFKIELKSLFSESTRISVVERFDQPDHLHLLNEYFPQRQSDTQNNEKEYPNEIHLNFENNNSLQILRINLTYN